MPNGNVIMPWSTFYCEPIGVYYSVSYMHQYITSIIKGVDMSNKALDVPTDKSGADFIKGYNSTYILNYYYYYSVYAKWSELDSIDINKGSYSPNGPIIYYQIKYEPRYVDQIVTVVSNVNPSSLYNLAFITHNAARHTNYLRYRVSQLPVNSYTHYIIYGYTFVKSGTAYNSNDYYYFYTYGVVYKYYSYRYVVTYKSYYGYYRYSYSSSYTRYYGYYRYTYANYKYYYGYYYYGPFTSNYYTYTRSYLYK